MRFTTVSVLFSLALLTPAAPVDHKHHSSHHQTSNFFVDNQNPHEPYPNAGRHGFAKRAETLQPTQGTKIIRPAKRDTIGDLSNVNTASAPPSVNDLGRAVANPVVGASFDIAKGVDEGTGGGLKHSDSVTLDDNGAPDISHSKRDSAAHDAVVHHSFGRRDTGGNEARHRAGFNDKRDTGGNEIRRKAGFKSRRTGNNNPAEEKKQGFRDRRDTGGNDVRRMHGFRRDTGGDVIRSKHGF